MNEESLRLREKLQARVTKALALSERVFEMPLISFETTADILPGSEDLVERVIGELKKTGHAVSHIRAADLPDGNQDLEGLLASLEKRSDVVICEGFGYKPIPKILVTKRVEEGLNMGLPQVVGYVANRDARALIPRFAPDDAQSIAQFIEENIIGGGLHG